MGGKNSFSVLLFQDLAVIPILAILPLLATKRGTDLAVTTDLHQKTTWIEGLPIGVQTVMVLGVVVIIIIAGRFFITPSFRLLAKTRLRELFTAAALLLVIGIALLLTQVGLSPALETFLAGVVLAQSEYRYGLEIDIEPFKGLLLGLFFIAVGASIDFNLIIAKPILVLELVLALVLAKFIILLLIGKFFKMGLDNNMLFAVALAQGGEFAFVLFSFSIQNNVMEAHLANPFIAVVALSMAFTPILIMINEKLIRLQLGTREKEKPHADAIDEKRKVIIAGFGRVGSTIGRFLQVHGVQATYLDIDPDNVGKNRDWGWDPHPLVEEYGKFKSREN